MGVYNLISKTGKKMNKRKEQLVRFEEKNYQFRHYFSINRSLKSTYISLHTYVRINIFQMQTKLCFFFFSFLNLSKFHKVHQISFLSNTDKISLTPELPK